jgi:hypothetical protein
MVEIKFIIARDKQGRLRHFKSAWYNHDTIARYNGVDAWRGVIEAGLIIAGHIIVLECINQKHYLKNASNNVLNTILLKSREAETKILYRIKEGD